MYILFRFLVVLVTCRNSEILVIYGISASLLGGLGSISNLRSHTIRSGKQIDKIIRAEIPNKDEDPEAFGAVENIMMHGP